MFTDYTDDDRTSMVRYYLDAAAEIVRRTSVSGARTYFNHIMAHGIILGPRREERGILKLDQIAWVNEKTKEARLPVLGILAILPGDEQSFPTLRTVQPSEDTEAMYRPDINGIYLWASRRSTDFSCGSIILHEAGHAQRALAEHRVGLAQPASLEAELLEEGELTYFTARLWAERGGTRYAALLTIARKRLNELMRGQLKFYRLPMLKVLLDELTEIFSRGPFDPEGSKLWSNFVLFAHLSWVEHNWQYDKPDGRAKVIALYREALDCK